MWLMPGILSSTDPAPRMASIALLIGVSSALPMSVPALTIMPTNAPTIPPMPSKIVRIPCASVVQGAYNLSTRLRKPCTMPPAQPPDDVAYLR